MKGVYVGEDKRHHHGTFGVIGLDLFDGQLGLPNQKFDFNPHIAANGVFWSPRIEPDAVKVHLGGGTASLRLTNVKVFDDHNLQNSLQGGGEKPVPATVSFDVRWSGVTRRVKFRDEKNGFSGKFIEDTATIEWSAKESGFAFTSDPAKTSKSVFAVIGHERNGIFFDKDDDDDDDGGD
jgi:hypothetical protein